MLENQDTPATPELTIDEKLANANLTDLANTPVKPLLDVLGQATTFYGYVDNYWISGGDKVTVRMELTHLAKVIKELEATKQSYYSDLQAEKRKVEKLEDYLDENWDDIDEEVREKLCDIFDIEAEVTKTVTITVTGTTEITAPRGYDWDSIGDDIDLNCETIINSTELTEASYGFSHDNTEVEVD